MKIVLLIPGWMKTLRFYEDRNDIRVCVGKLDEEAISADYVLGFSLGALIVLQNAKQIKGKMLLINPLFPKRSIGAWFVKWAQYIFHEGLFLEMQKFTRNPFRFIKEISHCVGLLRTDFSEILKSLPKGHLVVLRGRDDAFFCDEKAKKFLEENNITFVETDGGHNWSGGIEKTIRTIIQKSPA